VPAIPLPMLGATGHEPFSRVAPYLRSALLIGVFGGFLFAAILTTTAAFHANTGLWWEALVQAHGHLQLFGWAGLFVLGVALHFLPRLRGAPLRWPQLAFWILGLQAAGIALRGISQPLAAVSTSVLWRVMLVASGVLECLAFALLLVCLVGTDVYAPPLPRRHAVRKILPLLVTAFTSLGLAAGMNLVDTIQAAGTATGLIPDVGDSLNVTLGLLGFLVPIGLAMSVQALPMYAGLKSFSLPTLWIMSTMYVVGLLLYLLGIVGSSDSQVWSIPVMGLGWLCMGGALLTLVLYLVALMRTRGRIPAHIARLSPRAEQMERAYQVQISDQRREFGPFVALIASAYLWAALAAVILLFDGVSELIAGTVPAPVDTIRHCLTIGFISLLLAGISPRLVTAFSGGSIATARLVTATLWLGNLAAVLRVGSVLSLPLLGSESIIYNVLFGLSGPLGLALATCLAINIWPALVVRRFGAAVRSAEI